MKRATHFSAICCRRRSPVDIDTISYFFTSRAVSVPLPAPGFPTQAYKNVSINYLNATDAHDVTQDAPNMIMRNIFPSCRTLDASSAGAVSARVVFSANGSAFCGAALWLIPRRAPAPAAHRRTPETARRDVLGPSAEVLAMGRRARRENTEDILAR